MKPEQAKDWRSYSALVGSDVLSACFIATASAFAQVTGIALLLFPELAALSYDIFRRPHGTWAKSPVLLVVTPFLTGLTGTVTAQFLQFGLLSVLITLSAAILIVRVIRSPIVPAVAAGLLPLILGEKSWWYAPSLLVGTSILALVSLLRQRLYPPEGDAGAAAAAAVQDNHGRTSGLSWIPFFVAFLVLSTTAAVLTGERLLLLPPMVGVALELFVNHEHIPWIDRPFVIPLVCGLNALCSVMIIAWLGTGALVVLLVTVVTMVIVRIFDLHFPPAIAVGILPFFMPQLNFRYPVDVTAAATLLILIFVVWRWVAVRRDETRQSGP